MSQEEEIRKGASGTGPHTGEADTPKQQRGSRKGLWHLILKVCAWTAASLAALILLIMCLAAWILTPERLTPLVEKYGSEYLKADVKAERVELTVWSSFPSVRLDVTGLHLTSRTLKGQPDSVLNALGANPERLLDAESFSGSINPWRLLGGTISLGDISASGVGLNLVSYAEGINNYDIMPESEEKEEEPEESSAIDLRFGQITVKAPGGIHYRDASSGTDVSLAGVSLNVKPLEGDCKKLSTGLSGMLTLSVDSTSYIQAWPLDASGEVSMDLNSLDFSLPDYTLNVGLFKAKVNAALNAGDRPALKACSVSLAPIKASSLLKGLPEEMIAELPMLGQVDTDMRLVLAAEVKCPWRFDSPTLPDVNVSLKVPECRLALNDEEGRPLVSIDRIALEAAMLYTGASPEKSRVEVPLFNMSGRGMNLQMSAYVEELLAEDPLIGFRSRGGLDLSELSALIPYSGSTLTGEVEADAELRCRLSDMTALRYEHIEADGSLLIRNLVCELPALATRIYSHLASFSFGTALDYPGPRVPGTLLARAEIDTLHYAMPGMAMGLKEAVLRAGTTDDLLRTKTNDKEITPMGMQLTASRLRMDSEADTTKIRVSRLQADGSITRYEGNAESPLLKAALSAGGLLYADPTMRLGMKAFSSDLTAHLRKRKHKGKRRPRPHRAARQEYVVNVEVDEGVKSLFKTWGISGNLSSDKVRLTHLMYPVPIKVSHLNFDFSLDSVRLHSAHILSQDNSMTLSGTISNIRQLMLGRTRRPLKVRLKADIESLDINQVAYNYTLGTALAAQRGRLSRLSPEEQDAIVRAAAAVDTVQSMASDSLPLILPRNIDTRLGIHADKALYGDIYLYNLHTDLAINDGAASIDSLRATTDFGNAYLNLLYSSRNPELLNMAIDLGFSEIDLQKFYHTFPTVTEMMPALTDLSGIVGTKLVGSFDMYPNMDIDLNSINAVLNLSGTGLTLNQSQLIRKVARMMFIRKKGPLEITDMNIQVALHDNVLRLYPFKFGMEKYRFALLGQNDFASNMYYHLSVLKSPIPFKFGINIKGTFDKPKLRFGGAKYKDNEAREMVDLIEAQRVNFVKAMRLELRKLVNKAAVSYADRPEYKAYGQEREMKRGDDGSADDSNFSSPMDMLGNSLKAPALKALGNSGSALREFSKRYNIGIEQQDGKKEKGKKKK